MSKGGKSQTTLTWVLSIRRVRDARTDAAVPRGERGVIRYAGHRRGREGGMLFLDALVTAAGR